MPQAFCGIAYLPHLLCFLLINVILSWGIVVDPVAAQEFNCSVSMNYKNLSGSDYTYLDELQDQIREYMNLRNWTDDRFEDRERIDCTFQVTMLEALTLTSFRARLIVATRRPIYNTTQLSTVVQFSDESWQFDFPRGTPLVFDPDRHHPLTSVLNFYAYLMLGYDYDTFSEFGGTAHFEHARRVAELAQASGGIGWTQIGGDRSRGELIAQLLDPRFRELRKAYFDYHFEGLDRFIDETDAARANVLGVLGSVKALYEEVTRSYVLDVFFSTKSQELSAIFEGASLAGQAFDILSEIDPAHLSEYSRMVQ